MASLQVDKFRKMARKHGFITGYHVDTPAQGCGNDVVGGLGVVDHLHDEVDVRIVEYVFGFIGEESRWHCGGTRFGEVAHAYALYFGMGVFCLSEHVVDALTYGAESEKSYLYGIHMVCVLKKSLSMSLSWPCSTRKPSCPKGESISR